MAMKTSGGMNMLQGLKTKSPKCCDKSMGIPKGNTVNNGTRDNVAKTPSTIGERVA